MDKDWVLQRRLTLDGSLISTVFIMVITSSFLQINYVFKLLALVLTGLIHMLLYGCLIAEGVDHLDVTNRYCILNNLGREKYHQMFSFAKCSIENRFGKIEKSRPLLPISFLHFPLPERCVLKNVIKS